MTVYKRLHKVAITIIPRDCDINIDGTPFHIVSKPVVIQGNVVVTNKAGTRGYTIIPGQDFHHWAVERIDSQYHEIPDQHWRLLVDEEYERLWKGWEKEIEKSGYVGSNGARGGRCLEHTITDCFNNDFEAFAELASGRSTDYKDYDGLTLDLIHGDSIQHTEDTAYLHNLRCKHKGCNIKVYG